MNKNKNMGYIKAYRSFFLHSLWKEKRAFSRPEAWLDLLASAYHTARAEVFGTVPAVVGRGELPASTRFLAERWGWGASSVGRFLALLKKERMITVRMIPGAKQSIITLTNYETYNTTHQAAQDGSGHECESGTVSETVAGTPTGTLTGTRMGHQSGQYSGQRE